MKAAGHWDLPRRGREGRRLCLHFSHKSRWKPSRAFPLAAGLAGKPRTAAPAHTAMRTRCGVARRAGSPGLLASTFGGRGRAGRGAPPRYRARALGLSSLPGNLPPLPAAAPRRPGPGPPTAPPQPPTVPPQLPTAPPQPPAAYPEPPRAAPRSPAGSTKPPAAPSQHCPVEERRPALLYVLSFRKWPVFG